MRTSLFFFLILISNLVLSQTKINTLSYDYSKVKASLSITDNENKKVVVINQFKTSTDFLLFDENMHQIGKISEEVLDEKKEYLGSNFKEQKYYTYWYKDDNITIKELDFNQNSFKNYQVNFSPEKKKRKLLQYL